ncbi:MAG TPA: oligosaccharide flippase family protein [Solirubrobacterales bacterium]|nr:oligosaccharide flippase family protein [Solirubrobacterales bacterium]
MSRLRAKISRLRVRIAVRRRGELGGFATDSLYVAVWQGATSLADLAQIALIAHVLGLDQYGRFAVVVAFVMLVTAFFDVRVGVAATTLGARELQDPRRSAGIFQLSYLIDAVTGVLAFVVVVALSFAVGPGLVGGNGTLLIVLFAIGVLASTLEDSSLAVLRLLDRFRLVAAYTVGLEAARVALVAGALLFSEGLVPVILALVAQKMLVMVVQVATAASSFRAAMGRPLLRKSALDAVTDKRRQMINTVLHTNVVSYARLAQTQLPTVVIGAISGTAQAGLYRIGMAAAAAVGRLADPAYAALLPRVSRLFAAGRQDSVKRLIERASLISVPVMIVALAVVVLLRDPILQLLGGQAATDAAPVLAAGAVAFAINGAVFWNVGVLFAAGRARTVSLIAVITALTQATLLVPLVLALDAEGAALSFLVSMVLANLAMTAVALRLLARGAHRGPAAGASPGMREGDAATGGAVTEEGI